MPIYEYVCTECAHQFDSLQKLSDAPLSDCPSCKKPALKKKISAPSFRLSGSGWYETDFKSGNQKNLANSDNSSKPSNASKTPAADSKDKTGGDTKKSPKKDSAASKEAAA